ncbi:MAG: exosortase O [Anaerolineales bacterium]
MKEITHDQAQSFILAAADGLLEDPQRGELLHHLHSCQECRAVSKRLDTLHSDLQLAFNERWDDVVVPETPLVTELPQAEPLWPRLGRMAVNFSLAALWIWLYWAVFGYFRVIFSHEEFRTNQIILVIVLILFFVQFRKEHWRPRLDVLPHIFWPGLTLLLIGSVSYLLAERFLDINTLSASLFGLATYGLIGLWMSPRRWLAGLPAALLLIGTLPFGEHLQTFVGYPIRIATANIIQEGLQAIGINSVGVDTILVFESGLAQVDIPCSGIKSLWTGMLFLIAATWIERSSINLRWFGIAILMGILLFLANVARVAVLVIVGQVAGWELITELIHVPLGVLAFGVVCGVVLFFIRTQKPSVYLTPLKFVQSPPESDETSGIMKRPVWLAPFLAIGIAGMALVYTPRPYPVMAQAAIDWVFSSRMQVQVDPLSPELFAWVTKDGAEFADRWDFTWNGEADEIHGSLMFLTSNTWRGQHRPERCFEVQGITVETYQTVFFDDEFTAQMVLVSGGPQQATALYWLQTGQHATDDFAARIWSDLGSERQPWVLVTLLLDDVYPPNSAEVRSIAEIVRTVVADSLEGGLP